MLIQERMQTVVEAIRLFEAEIIRLEYGEEADLIPYKDRIDQIDALQADLRQAHQTLAGLVEDFLSNGLQLTGS